MVTSAPILETSRNRVIPAVPRASGWSTLLAAGWPAVPDAPELDPDASARDRIRAAAASELSILTVPAQFGGGGGGLLEAASAQRTLGALDPSIAIALNMHMLSMGLLADHWRRNRDNSWMLLEAIASEHFLIGSAFAEPGGGSNILRSSTRAKRTSDGVSLTGVKFPCSLATTAEMFCLSAQVEGEDTTIVALCPASSPGVAVTGAWPSLGMRASDTARLELHDVAIDRELVFHEGPSGSIDEIVIGGLVWFVVLASATYHGALTSLLEIAAASPARSSLSRKEAGLTSAAAELVRFGASCRGVAQTYSDGRVAGAAAMVAAAALRIELGATVDRVVAALRPLIGAPAYTQGSAASALILDALAAHHHPPSVPLAEALIAAAGAGRPLSLDL
jgi:alkylation response protein AidB-like acyl-CoA dehydrogenase